MSRCAAPAVAATMGIAGKIMSSPVITVVSHATRTQVADLLTGHQISAVPVIDDAGAVVGLVSEYDLLTKSHNPVVELVTTVVISVSPDCPLNDLRHLLVERHIRRVPVLLDGRLVRKRPGTSTPFGYCAAARSLQQLS